jgi:hypothetical protein
LEGNLTVSKSTPVNSAQVKSASVGAPYLQLAIALQSFLKKKRNAITLAQVIRDVRDEWQKRNQRPPAPQTFYMAVYGVRPLPVEVILFMVERYGFEIGFDDCFNSMNAQGARVKSNDVRMPRMRELF